jgi:hypothetical protein
LTNYSGFILVQIGGQPAVRVQTGIPHALTENTLVSIDGVEGSTQLNNNKYYVKIISNTIVDLYTQPYDPAYAVPNYPVEFVSAYIGGGYIWRAGLFVITLTLATETIASTDRITVESTAGLIVNTPVLFTEVGANIGDAIMGSSNIVDGTTYYVHSINPETLATALITDYQYQIISAGTTDFTTVGAPDNNAGTIFTATGAATGDGTAASLNEFTISETRDGNIFALGNATGTITVTQWEQFNVDRLWVTVNGYRVPSSKLRLNAANELSILTTIEPGDEVIITSMMPSATPSEQTYINFVDKDNNASVYRANSQTRTFLRHALNDIDNEIYLDDLSKVTHNDSRMYMVMAPMDEGFEFGLYANKEVICGILVYNETKNIEIPKTQFEIHVEALSPILIIQNNSNYIEEGDEIMITVIEGRDLFINGEFIKFYSCDPDTNSVGNLQRGANGTGMQLSIPKYTEVYGILPENRLLESDYNETWNSYTYNTVLGDPLSISTTQAAEFLRSNIQ